MLNNSVWNNFMSYDPPHFGCGPTWVKWLHPNVYSELSMKRDNQPDYLWERLLCLTNIHTALYWQSYWAVLNAQFPIIYGSFKRAIINQKHKNFVHCLLLLSWACVPFKNNSLELFYPWSIGIQRRILKVSVWRAQSTNSSTVTKIHYQSKYS